MFLHYLLYCKVPILIKRKSLCIKCNASWMSQNIPPTGNILFTVCSIWFINPLNTKLNPICHLLALLGAHPLQHFSRIRVNLREAFPVEEILEKPQCSSHITLVLFIYWRSLSYITSYRKLENEIFIVISVYIWTNCLCLHF